MTSRARPFQHFRRFIEKGRLLVRQTNSVSPPRERGAEGDWLSPRRKQTQVGILERNTACQAVPHSFRGCSEVTSYSLRGLVLPCTPEGVQEDIKPARGELISTRLQGPLTRSSCQMEKSMIPATSAAGFISMGSTALDRAGGGSQCFRIDCPIRMGSSTPTTRGPSPPENEFPSESLLRIRMELVFTHFRAVRPPSQDERT